MHTKLGVGFRLNGLVGIKLMLNLNTLHIKTLHYTIK